METVVTIILPLLMVAVPFGLFGVPFAAFLVGRAVRQGNPLKAWGRFVRDAYREGRGKW